MFLGNVTYNKNKLVCDIFIEYYFVSFLNKLLRIDKEIEFPKIYISDMCAYEKHIKNKFKIKHNFLSECI